MDELSHTAFHEAGHAVAAVTAFKDARWLPNPCPSPVVLSVEIRESMPGEWTGDCTAMGIFSTKWPARCVSPRYADLMEAQVSIHLGGSIAEAIHRGVRGRHQVLPYAHRHCHLDEDLKLAKVVLTDLRRLGRYDEQRLVDRTLAVLLGDWSNVERLALALIERRRIEGAEVKAIIEAAPVGDGHQRPVAAPPMR